MSAAAPAPELVVPFRIGREEVPRKAARLDRLQGIYLPFWMFSLRADSTWEADIGEWWYADRPQTSPEDEETTRAKKARIRRTEWHPLRGRYHSWHSCFLVSGSHGLPQEEVLAVGPFHLQEMRRYRPEYLTDWSAEPVDVSRADALAACQSAIREEEGACIRGFLPGDVQAGVEWTTTFSQISEDLLLLPFWIGTCSSRGKLYRYVLNGQTGKATTGTRPSRPARSGLAEAPPLPFSRCDSGKPAEPAPAGQIEARVVPFQIDRTRATTLVRASIGRGFFLPGHLLRASTVTELRRVFLPGWSFSAGCHVCWTADSDITPAGSKAEWAPRYGEHETWSEHVLVPASGALTTSETGALGPWDLSQAVPSTPELVRGVPSEAFSITRRQARPQALAELEKRMRADSAPKIPGRHRNVRVNPIYTKLEAWPLLVPVWILTCEYRGRTYRFLVNGQTGKVEGTAPVSPWKLLAAAALVVLVLLLLALLSGT
jgi:hypothetical protein